MTPRTFLLAGLALALAAAPTAAAQGSASLTLALGPPDQPVAAGTTTTLTGTATYVAEWTAQLATDGIQVQYVVANAPEWATVVVSPSSDIFTFGMLPMPSATVAATKSFTVTILGAPGAADGATGILEIQAVTEGTLLVRPALATGAVALTYEAGEPCGDASSLIAASAAPAADAPAEDTGLTTQSAAPATFPAVLPIAAVAGCAVVGVGAGLLLRKRRG